MNKRVNLLLSLTAVVLSIVVLFPLSSVSGEKPSVTIHGLIGLKGGYGSISVPLENGGKDYLEWVAGNGGLDIDLDGKGDVEIKYMWAEVGQDVDQFMSAYKRFRMGRARFSIAEMVSHPKPRPFIMEVWPSPQAKALKTIFATDGVVAVGIGFNDTYLHPPAWNFALLGSLGESAAGAIECYVDHLWPKREKSLPAKVAVMTWEFFSDPSANKLIKMQGSKTGKYEVVSERWHREMPTDREIREFLAEVENRNIDIVWSNATVETSAALMKGLHRLGLSNRISVLGNSGAPADRLLDLVGLEMAEGYMAPGSVFIPAAEPEEPGVKFAKQLYSGYRREAGSPDALYLEGIRMKAVMLESVRRALIGVMKRDRIDLKTACKKITGKEIKEFGIQTLAGYSAHDLTSSLQSAPSDGNDRRLSNRERLIGVREGKVSLLSPWYQVPRLTGR